jgi:hypothetical protein
VQYIELASYKPSYEQLELEFSASSPKFLSWTPWTNFADCGHGKLSYLRSTHVCLELTLLGVQAWLCLIPFLFHSPLAYD